MKARGFDAQLEQNLKKLSAHTPSDFVWGAIQEKLEKKKRALIWPPFLIAASLTGLFLLAFYLIRQGAVVLESESIPQEILAETPIVELEETKVETKMEKIVPSETETQLTSNTSKTLNRRSFEPIQVPNTTLAFSQELKVSPLDLRQRNPMGSIPVVPNETYHRVAISWGLKEKAKLKLGTQSDKWLERSESLTAQEKTKPTKNPLKFIIK